MRVRPVRIYADTSVFGGAFDPEFEEVTNVLFDQVLANRFLLVSSAVVEDELTPAPPHVRELFTSLAPLIEMVEITQEATDLQEAYLEAGILSPNHASDAFHVALATASACRAIVSWNFKHIVHLDRIYLYNGVNTLNGYPAIAIHSPREVIKYEEGL